MMALCSPCNLIYKEQKTGQGVNREMQSVGKVEVNDIKHQKRRGVKCCGMELKMQGEKSKKVENERRWQERIRQVMGFSSGP